VQTQDHFSGGPVAAGEIVADAIGGRFRRK
jgi:hypothetical protein